MADDIQETLGEILAPEDDMFDIVEDEGVVDPLAEGNELVVEENDPLSFTLEGEIPDNELSSLTDTSIGMADDLMGEEGDEVEIIDSTVDDDDLVEIEEDVEIPLENEVPMTPEEEEEELEIVDTETVNPLAPGELVASVLDTARTFVQYADDSKNSIRRAHALCDEIENKIIAGVTRDAKEHKLSLAQLRLLDDIEEGVHYTRAHLERCSNKTKQIYAKSIGDQGLLNGLYDPFCSTIARVLVNAQVQGGKKIQDVFQKLKDKYNIDKREEFQIGQILLDMGYPVRSLLDGEDMIEQRYA